MLSCVKATELMEIADTNPLSFRQHLQLRMHMVMCSGCRNYMKQTALIKEVLRKNFNAADAVPDTAALEAAIISKIS